MALPQHEYLKIPLLQDSKYYTAASFLQQQ